MITDLRAAQLCAAIYAPDAISDKTFHVYDDGGGTGVCWGIVQDGDIDLVILRGSLTPHDWFEDMFAAPYVGHRPFGPVHHGFNNGLDTAWSRMKNLLRSSAKVMLTGHSLGAARATILTGIMIDDGGSPAGRIVFGEPKPGFQRLADFIKAVPARSYRNGMSDAHDIVTDLPLPVKAWGLNYVHPAPLTLVSGPPPIDDTTGMFAWHHIGLYVTALSNLNPA